MYRIDDQYMYNMIVEMKILWVGCYSCQWAYQNQDIEFGKKIIFTLYFEVCTLFLSTDVKNDRIFEKI